MKKNKINKTLLIYLMTCSSLLSSFICTGQMIESQGVVDSTKQDVINFLISQNDLEKGKEIKEYDKRIHILELLEETVLGYNRIGIYRIRVFTSHTKQYLVIKNNSEHQILDTDDLGKTLQAVINFLVEQKLPNVKILAYIDSVTQIYKINENRNPAKIKQD